jgi:hypothetical protein
MVTFPTIGRLNWTGTTISLTEIVTAGGDCWKDALAEPVTLLE